MSGRLDEWRTVPAADTRAAGATIAAILAHHAVELEDQGVKP